MHLWNSSIRHRSTTTTSSSLRLQHPTVAVHQPIIATHRWSAADLHRPTVVVRCQPVYSYILLWCFVSPSTQAEQPWTWDPQVLANNFSTMMLTPPPTDNWYMDSGASSHMVSNSDCLSHVHPPTSFTLPNIIVGNGSSLPIIAMGSTSFRLTDRSLHLHNILVSPHII